MASTESTTRLSSVLASLSETLVNFRSESVEIESKFFELVEGIAELGPMMVDADVISMESPALDSVTIERLEDLDRSIANQRVEFAGKQDQLSNDVGELREIVDRQVQLFAAWFNSTWKAEKGNSPRAVRPKKSSEDQVLNDVCAQFEVLTGAATSVGKVSTT
ncbi:MAG TPA: hypothetical protein QF564_05430 [Pirellulaceae bacterium]|nr:hypothetical protein [Pirellulaceae bacterium]